MVTKKKSKKKPKRDKLEVMQERMNKLHQRMEKYRTLDQQRVDLAAEMREERVRRFFASPEFRAVTWRYHCRRQGGGLQFVLVNNKAAHTLCDLLRRADTENRGLRYTFCRDELAQAPIALSESRNRKRDGEPVLYLSSGSAAHFAAAREMGIRFIPGHELSKEISGLGLEEMILEKLRDRLVEYAREDRNA